jgi:hypothetical protein
MVVLAASASFQIKPFGNCIFVSCSSPVTGFLKLSTFTSTIPGTEKLLFFPSMFASISTNCGSRKRNVMQRGWNEVYFCPRYAFVFLAPLSQTYRIRLSSATIEYRRYTHNRLSKEYLSGCSAFAMNDRSFYVK